ncbi:MAG: sigma factor [Eubacteriales bacterium]|nr:sigma factor [Eubacteriales bacterium]
MGLDESTLVLRAARDERAREELIRRQEKNILRIASRAKHRFVTKSDDEWSVALCAFSRAIDTYVPGKGDFLPYAERLIRNGLIDAHRAETKHAPEVAVAPEEFEGNAENGAPSPVLYAVVESSVRAADTALRDEILAAGAALRKFGFGFYDLTDCSPGRKETRAACQRAADAILDRQDDLQRLLRTGQLPAQRLMQSGGFSQKLLERYRKYIIASVVILTGDFPILAGYIRNAGRGE